MSRTADRKKLRREYLKKKAGAYVAGTASGLLIVPSLILTVFFAIGVLAVAVSSSNLPIFAAVAAVLTFGVFAVVFGVITWAAWGKLMAAQKAARVTYVPPVTPDTLPSNEILVRGSEAPALQSEILLRATQKGQESPKEELLRGSEMDTTTR